MTYEKAKEELKDIDSFCHAACIACNNEWFCPSYCDMLLKAEKLDFDRIVKCYARHDGDMSKVFRYIKETKLNRKKGGY